MQKDYTFLESTISLCNKCEKRIEAKIVRKNNSIYILKKCKVHGEQLELLEENAEYHLRKKQYDKPGNSIIPETKLEKGCPFDCGLCSEHEQHTCNALIDVTGKCDLCCPICYASSGKGKHLSLAKIEKMMDFFQLKESGKAEILQISGGEPTTHPEILKIIELAKSKNFRYLMLNTNGLRIAADEEFVKKLSEFRGRFEIYLQFDGFKESTYKHLRGRGDLLKTKLKAIENLKKYKIPVTLVATIEKGINEDELGKMFEFAINTPGIRGINFQPVTFFGRNNSVETQNRITLSGVIDRLEIQTSGALKKVDIVPLPCDVERVAVCYFYRDRKGFIPLTRHFDVKSYLPLIDNTFGFDAEKILKENKRKNPILSCCVNTSFLGGLARIIPRNYDSMAEEEKVEWWDNYSFRISVVSFLDKYNFDIKSMKKECVHFITPELKRIPFSSYNMFHRKKGI